MELNSRMEREGYKFDYVIMRKQTGMLVGSWPGVPVNFTQEVPTENARETASNLQRIALEGVKKACAPISRGEMTKWTKSFVND